MGVRPPASGVRCPASQALPAVLVPGTSSSPGCTRGPPTLPGQLPVLPGHWGMTALNPAAPGGLTTSRCSGCGESLGAPPLTARPLQVHPDTEGAQAPAGVGQPGRRALFRVQKVSVQDTAPGRRGGGWGRTVRWGPASALQPQARPLPEGQPGFCNQTQDLG